MAQLRQPPRVRAVTGHGRNGTGTPLGRSAEPWHDERVPEGAYRLDQLGWLQFERLCSLVLECEAGLTGIDWLGRADEGRIAIVDRAEASAGAHLRLPDPSAIVAAWVRDDVSPPEQLFRLLDAVAAMSSLVGVWRDHVVVLTNLQSSDAEPSLRRGFPHVEQFVVLGERELGESLDRHPELRAAMPSVLGLRDLAPLIEGEALARSSLDVEEARHLAGVFWPTRAYGRARAVLARHRFVVLTGPPEMGKTAIARMLALAQLTDGWEAHECNSPDRVWAAFDAGRRQVFVADDAFGSTEYRADSAELWARELGRILRVLDDRHWLVWTSRPAPLKAGLRRVQRERGSERFPAPGEVLIDASELDLAEKTLILFRHAKNRAAGEEARRLLRSAAISIVEHPHFTPERIRRFVAERLDELPQGADSSHAGWVRRAVERELARPTDAMRNSFRALEDEHRELLIALLDAPAGLIDERDLAATVRRHHAGGLTRPPGDLIDRLTDHFLRITPLGIGWVHPSWRDLVIGELRENPGARRRFLAACGIYGVILALSQEGGIAGERSLPLLTDDRDWDALADRVPVLVAELEDQDVARLLFALVDTLKAELEPAQHAELRSLAQYTLEAVQRGWDRQARALTVFALEAWYMLRSSIRKPVEPPAIARTWTELRPTSSLLTADITARELGALDEWLALAQVLSRYDHVGLTALGFYDRERKLLGHTAVEVSDVTDPELRPLAEGVLARIRNLLPSYTAVALRYVECSPREQRWWVPEDISAPPTSETVEHAISGFTREDVDRVLSDL